MGDEILNHSFDEEAEGLFHQRLREETKILSRWFKEESFSQSTPLCGLELEGWLTTKDFVPAPKAPEFLKTLGHDLVVPEISRYNFEMNSLPLETSGNCLSLLEKHVLELWEKVEAAASEHDLVPLMIGTLPTLRDYMLSMEYLTPGNRYTALNKKIMDARGGRPLTLDIEGEEALYFKQESVITECAATSLQIHYGVPLERAKDFYNASIVASSFMAAVGANSPYFFGHDLWSESRIKIFEQSVECFSYRRKGGEFARRVSLGSGYVHDSLFELFLENLDGHPILLPELFSKAPEELCHLKLQNGTIWRWNRPLVGTDAQGNPSLRLEFRVPSAGPSIVDAIGNIALQIALVELLVEIDDLTNVIPFSKARENFYEACKRGLDAEIYWIDGNIHSIRALLVSYILPRGQEVLKNLNYDESDINHYLKDVIGNRVKSRQNGAFWQRRFVAQNGMRFQEMLESYSGWQRKNLPVYAWGL